MLYAVNTRVISCDNSVTTGVLYHNQKKKKAPHTSGKERRRIVMMKTLSFEEMEQVTGGYITPWRKFELEDSVFIAICTPGMTLDDEIRAHARNKEEKDFIT